MQQSPDA